MYDDNPDTSSSAASRTTIHRGCSSLLSGNVHSNASGVALNCRWAYASRKAASSRRRSPATGACVTTRKPVVALERLEKISGAPRAFVKRWNGKEWVTLGGTLNRNPAYHVFATLIKLDR